ncbi:hypothetical protein AKJ65_05930 [candidate division MSBL1 archaeon SCGC-AAA259E19]|uniref:HAD family hydrolase n=1 Tax=candidate division MSBL1 archaeon SCGC-AAA259E19 TaxID=1698264 RepID=A0A133UHU8_9EURY|nr:hypothetical protein AKJ65_05930 [candidate division MSBL1 archaeon SCGC-AAA259E19]
MSEEKVEGILFDLDGVLIDSFDAWLSAYNEALEKFGKEALDEDEFREKCWGPEVKDSMKKFGLEEEAVNYCYSRYEANMDKVEISPEINRILGSIEKKMGLVTNTNTEQMAKILELHDFRRYFDVIVHGDDVEKKKPAPDSVLKACKLLKIRPESAILVGDTESDVRAGRKAGCKVIGVGIEGDWRIESLKELPDLLSEISG